MKCDTAWYDNQIVPMINDALSGSFWPFSLTDTKLEDLSCEMDHVLSSRIKTGQQCCFLKAMICLLVVLTSFLGQAWLAWSWASLPA